MSASYTCSSCNQMQSNTAEALSCREHVSGTCSQAFTQLAFRALTCELVSGACSRESTKLENEECMDNDSFILMHMFSRPENRAGT